MWGDYYTLAMVSAMSALCLVSDQNKPMNWLSSLSEPGPGAFMCYGSVRLSEFQFELVL